MAVQFSGSSASSESFASLQSDLAETLASAELAVADELFSALDVIDSSAALRRSLTDPALEPAARTGVVASLFGAKAQPSTVRILEAVVSRRWGAERDLGDAVEALAVSVVAAKAERDGLQGLEALESALLSFRRTVADSHELQRALTEQQAPAEAKQKLAAALSPQVSAEARLLIDRAVTAPRGLRPSALIERFAEQIAARQQRWIAQVTVAKNLDSSYLEKLSASLDKYFGRELKLDVVVDPTVVGGIRVQVGDEVVDSTVSSRLNSLSRKISR
ncbi:F0F1 ATP synthase subunit delta [Nesterenkonia alkaliphila]|uniref:ATP synthase subunit delta n=1 Tax=Nesterenkonia alkaliphila TaxID=1463631 RepID=A0A7K1UG22_9MICC|nr:F0F1 ATP synthase subunit delta [Nesterenkonia alkaliphila]MVT25344.1 F0F1 ATP synthase subunit delta [Nesterenkonia alkaliphila]GFZ94427.1 ATP synthase subunit delta [Nesterenkonia alkaliphila]